jgi:hypothetical protein
MSVGLIIAAVLVGVLAAAATIALLGRLADPTDDGGAMP